MWTASALASSAAPAHGKLWRVVEHQYTVSSRKLARTAADQELLEDILEETKPLYPPGAAHLHSLLKTPFRYFPPPPHGSRFRASGSTWGVFYGAELIRTALAEFSYWRRRFLSASPGTPYPANQEMLTAFSAAYASDQGLDFTAQPLARDRKLWIRSDDYSATQELAASALNAGIELIRYESVRDPQQGDNLALLNSAVFTASKPAVQQTWYLYINQQESHCQRAQSRESYTFSA